MSCPQIETTLLWLHGELEPEAELAHEGHLADCAPCQAAVAEQELVAAAVRPVAAALTVRELDGLPAGPANRPMWVALAAVAALAAMALVGLGFGLQSRTGLEEVADTDLAALSPEVSPSVVDPPLFGELDAGLEALDLQLAELSYEMHSL